MFFLSVKMLTSYEIIKQHRCKKKKKKNLHYQTKNNILLYLKFHLSVSAKSNFVTTACSFSRIRYKF